MITIIYDKPHNFKDGIWLIGWSKTRFEKCKANIYHRGTLKEAQTKIDSFSCKKYKKR